METVHRFKQKLALINKIHYNCNSGIRLYTICRAKALDPNTPIGFLLKDVEKKKVGGYSYTTVICSCQLRFDLP